MRPFDPALLRALPATRGPVGLLTALGIVSGVVAITQAVLLGVLVGRVVTGDAFADVLGWLVASLGLRGILAAATEQAARWAGLRVVAVVRLATLRHWLALPEGRRPGTDAAVARATEGVSALEAYVARYLPALVTGAVVPALTVGTLLVIDPWSALIVVLTLPLLPLFAALIGQHTQAETEQRWGAMALLAGHFLDVVRGLPTLVAYGRADAQVEVVRTVGERHRSATMRTLRTAFLSTAALELLATISVAMVAVAVGLRLAYGAMDLTVGLVAILLAPEAYWPVRRVGQEFHNAADGATVLAELGADGVLGGPAEAERAGGRRPGRGLALEHVSYAHPGRERTIVDLTLHAPAGPGLTALVGPSGAGKTTVLELLAGLREPDVGLVSAPDAHLAGQRPVILPGTVRDNLLLVGGAAAEEGAEGGREDSRLAGDERGSAETRGPVDARGPDDAPGAVDAPRPSSRTHPGDDELVAALRQVGLWDQLAERDGLETPLGDDGFGLSAGQRARLALARALLSPAPLVLLDEPTANVAAEAVPALRALITGLARERLVVVVTHDPDLAAQADQVWRLTAAEDGGAALLCHIHRPDDKCDTRAVHIDGVDASGPGGHPSTHGERAHVPGEVEPLPLPTGRRGLVVACLLGGASVGCGVALTATSGWLIVQASTMPVILTLLVAIVGVRAFGIFRPVLRYAERLVSHESALGELAARRADVFARLVPLTPAALGRRSRGEVLTAVVRDLDDVVDEQVRVVVPAWSAVIATTVGVVLAAWHVPSAGVVLILGGALVAVVAAADRVAEQVAQAESVARRGEVQHRTTALVSRLLAVQAVTGLRADRTHLLAPVAQAEQAQRRAEQRLITARATALALLWVVVAGTVAAVVALTWRALTADAITAPVAAMVALIPMALADTWVGAADIAGARARARAAGHRLEQVLGRTPAVAAAASVELTAGRRGTTPARPRTSVVGGRTAPVDHRTGEVGGHSAGTPSLRLDRTGARWPAPPTAVDDHPLDLHPLDLDLPPGSRVALTGPNGVGKSTALAVLARSLDPAVGRYEVDGTDVLDLDLQQVRALVALVDDEPHAFAGTVRANLALAAPYASDADLVAALDAVDLGRWFATLPEGLGTRLGGLSGGERARLSMARAMVSGRPVVLLDEPTAHLDDATAERAMGGLLASRDPGTGVVVLVTHRPATAAGWTAVDLGATLASGGARADDRLPCPYG